MLPIQKRLLLLLKEIKTICEDNNIQWFLMYGTLLGAIRHNGFIPWDDDADIVMTHDNWLKFKDAFTKSPFPNRSLTSVDIDASNYGQAMARYHDITQEQLIKYCTIFNLKQGVYVDILILDNFPDDIKKQKEYNQTLIDYCELAQKRYCPSSYLPGKSNYKEKIVFFLLKNRQKELQSYINKLSTLGDKGNKFLIQRYCINHLYSQEYLAESIFVPFEDTLLPIPKKFYEVLCLQYGENWMYIPQNKISHDDNILSVKESQQGSLVQEYAAIHNGIAHNILYILSKIINTIYIPKRNTWKISSRDIISEYVKYELKMQKYKSDEARILRYLAVQTNVWFVGRLVSAGWWNWYNHSSPALIDINDELLTDSLKYLIKNDGLSLAFMLLKAIDYSGKECSQQLIYLIDVIRAIKQANAYFYEEDYSQAIHISSHYLSVLPDNILLWRIYILAGYTADPREYILPESLPTHLSKDPEIAFVRAALALRERKIGCALTLMRVCARGTRNGIVLRKLLDLGKQAQQILQSKLQQRRDMLLHLEETLVKIADTLSEPGLVTQNNEVQIQTSLPFISSAAKNIAIENQKYFLRYQKKQLELLYELSRLCESCGVRYYLFGNALRAAATRKSVSLQTDRLSIAIDARECRKLLKFYKRHIRSDRFLESPLSNPDFPEFALYYGAKDTLEIDTLSYGFRQYHGIYVEVKILSIAQSSRWKRALRMLAESTWAMEHGLMPITVGRYLFHIILSGLRLVLGKKRIAHWLFRRIFLKGKRIYSPKENYQILWKKRFINLPIKWFSGNTAYALENKKMPVPLSEGVPSLLKKLYGAQWNAWNKSETSNIDPFHISDSCCPYEKFLEHLQTTSCNLTDIWQCRLHLLRFGWFRTFFQRKLARDWNFLLFLNDRYRMYRDVLPLKKQIQYSLARGDEKRFTKLMTTSVMKECLRKTERYLSQGLCFNFDPEMFNIIIEYWRAQKKIPQVKRLLALNKKQKYKKITLNDITQKEI